MSDDSIESVLASLGYTNPMDAAWQQARMLLLGRLSRYEAVVQQIESSQEGGIEALREGYHTEGRELREADEDYLTWRWYREAADQVKNQLATLSLPAAE